MKHYCPECNHLLEIITTDSGGAFVCRHCDLKRKPVKDGTSLCRHSIPTDRRCFECWPQESA